MKTKSFFRSAALAVVLTAVSGIPASPFSSTASASITLDEKDHDEKAVKIIETMIEKLGGVEKLESIKSIKQTGTISIPMAGITGLIESYSTKPDKFLLKVVIPAIGQTLQGLNGEIAWSTDPMGGPRILSEEETKATQKEADISSRIRFREDHKTIAYVEETEFDGKNAHKIRLVDNDGEESFEFYSTETGLQIGMEADVPSQMGNTHTITYIRAYTTVDGHTLPTTIVQKVGPTEVIITLNDFVFNEVEDSVYDLPPAINALIKAIEAKDSKDKAAP